MLEYVPSATAQQIHEKNLRHDQMLLKLAAHQRSQPSNGDDQALPIPTRTVNTNAMLFTPDEALKVLGWHRKSVKSAPVLSHYQPQHTRAPITFPYMPESELSKLSRPVGAKWTQILTGVSTTSLAGGQLRGTQGGNLIKIIQQLRQRTFLRVTQSGQPVQAREQVVLQVEGEGGYLALACGLSVSTFYRALQHPLAHLFIRTQKVQRQMPDGERQNVGTLFTVAHYEPVIPPCLEDAMYAEPVEEDGVFVVPVLTCQDDRTKERPLTTQIQKSPVDKTRFLAGGLSSAAQTQFQQILDSVPLATRSGAAFDSGKESSGAGAAAALARLGEADPGMYAFAIEVAKHHDTLENRAVAALGYYKAVVHLGAGVVGVQVRAVARWIKQGQQIDNPGAVLMNLINKKARAETGFNIRDLGMVKGSVNA